MLIHGLRGLGTVLLRNAQFHPSWLEVFLGLLSEFWKGLLFSTNGTEGTPYGTAGFCLELPEEFGRSGAATRIAWQLYQNIPTHCACKVAF